MKPQSSRFEPAEVDRLIAKFGEKPAENTRSALESELHKQRERFERTRSQQFTRERTRDEGRER